LSRDPRKRERQLKNLKRWPAPPPGNRRRLLHGGAARQATLIVANSWAEKIMAELEREAPLRDETGGLPAHDRQVVELLASCLARLQSVSQWVDLHGVVDEKGQPRPACELERLLRSEAARHLDALGMSPSSRARLGLELARAEATLEDVAEAGGEAWRRRLEGDPDASA
jgi:hypothetical protein